MHYKQRVIIRFLCKEGLSAEEYAFRTCTTVEVTALSRSMSVDGRDNAYTRKFGQKDQ
jgi:hypothetical protein